MMSEFTIQADSVDVTQIMGQIRQRIREKRGADYTEQQIQELASVKLERFLDPRQVRSNLVEHYRKLESPGWLDPIEQAAPIPAPEAIAFNEESIYASSRGLMGTLLRFVRRLLNPLLRLFFNPDPIIFAMARQSEINTWTLHLLQRQTDLVERVNKQFEQVGKKFAAREDLDALNYEVLNNLVVEMTRLAVDMKNHKMRVESVAGRLDFDERRARALESVVQTRSTPPGGETDESEANGAPPSPTPTRRRRRRPRRRSGGPSAISSDGANTRADTTSSPDTGPDPQPAPPTDASSGSAGVDTAQSPGGTEPGTDTPAPEDTPSTARDHDDQ
ncbi:MAG: hypothetical protein VYE68_09420 [Acidobacteriota bacterium]|nr:hypothetical protein [Acidobacteriota bacterium]